MKYLFILVISVAFFSCQKQQDQYYIEPALMPYWNQFKYEAERLGADLPDKNIVMSIKEDVTYEGSVASGLCYNSKKTATIYIAKHRVDQTNGEYSIGLEATIFHELGHAYGRHHEQYYYDSAYVYTFPKTGQTQVQSAIWPVSLMTVNMFRKYYYDGSKREYYLRELFGLENWEEREGVVLLECDPSINY